MNQDRKSLYEIVHKKREVDNKSISRLLYSGMIDQNFKGGNTTVQQKIEQMMKDLEDNTKSKLTGYLTIKASYVIHFMEGETDCLNSFLKQLYIENSKSDKPIFNYLNVLGFNEETPQRYYNKMVVDLTNQLQGTVPSETDKSENQVSERVG